MEPFEFYQPLSIQDAVKFAGDKDSSFLAGGTELLNWMRIGIAAPKRVVDITRVPGIDSIEELHGHGLRVGALAKLNDVAEHPDIVRDYPVLSQAILKAASAQIRNLATIGANPLQRVRCPYYRSDDDTPCNKRTPGSGCAALNGFNDKHAIFGWTTSCVAVQPSDPAVALAALDAFLLVYSATGMRRIPATQFHVTPDVDPVAHTILKPGELITGIELGPGWRKSAYLKIRERESYEYATVSVAVALRLDADNRTILAARIALGSVAMKPWRLHATEQRLIGMAFDAPEVSAAVDEGFAEARPLSRNGYKIKIARNATIRTINTAARA
ncbi:xanthine dehydrogenase family protein subunit M [Pseudomonas sp. HN11]|uniref:FAD binding domain-containing protein n=1 Tax=Pseudomonas sp. HN11 TaxID=1344094 RepID=UPI001F3851E3|nr:xanthine dehydrogenase family protein subunit M [Pseudomonas sp. HN11]UII69886.1 xanthine dehydrogenase family protein subunit M [Pseudomonas sp. HN11]